jgi:hypothetical protein
LALSQSHCEEFYPNKNVTLSSLLALLSRKRRKREEKGEKERGERGEGYQE